MPFFHFFWTDEAESYIAEHGISPEDFEFVLSNERYTKTSHSSGRPVAMGYTPSGDFIICVYEMLDEITVYPITAYKPESK